MKAIDLYNTKSESESNDLNELRGNYKSHIPEIDENIISWFDDEINTKNKKVLIKTIKDFDFDGRRNWKLATVWFENKPVMIIQNAGREGDDHYERFVTDSKLYKKMIIYVLKLIPTDIVYTNLIDENEDIAGIDAFYGNSLDGFFENIKVISP